MSSYSTVLYSEKEVYFYFLLKDYNEHLQTAFLLNKGIGSTWEHLTSVPVAWEGDSPLLF